MRRQLTPQEKKILSYSRDRRNVYGENDKASRKSIPLGKARSTRAYRVGAKQAMRAAGFEADVAAAEVRVRRFSKVPDAALGTYLDSYIPLRSSPPSALRVAARQRRGSTWRGWPVSLPESPSPDGADESPR